MAKKKLDLTEQYGKEEQPEVKKKVSKYSQFLESELNSPTPPPEASKPNAGEAKFKRINMAFSEANYELLQSETIRLNINLTHFINSLVRLVDEKDIDEYISSQGMRIGAIAPKRKGYKSKKTCLRLPMWIYDKIAAGAQKHGTTVTQYINLLIELYNKEN